MEYAIFVILTVTRVMDQHKHNAIAAKDLTICGDNTIILTTVNRHVLEEIIQQHREIW
jgi:arginine repressor